MKKGYVIAKNKLAKEFFTSTSAYDRPVWLPMAEATTYPTVEMANAAMQKLIRKGQYQVLVTEMNLSISPIEPMGDKPMGMGGDDEELPPEDGEDLEGLDGEELPPEDGEDLEGLDGEEDPEGDDEDAMVAGTTGADGDDLSDFEFDPEAEGEDMVTPGDEIDPDGEDDPDSEGGDISDDELDDLLGDEAGLDGEIDPEGEDEPEFGSRGLGMAKLEPMGSPRMESATVPVVSFKDKAANGKDESQFAGSEKIRVPSNVISSLNAVATDFDKQAEFSKTSDEARSSFCMTVADAARDIVALLSKGTAESVKLANVRLSSYMNPITSHFPPEAIKFIYSGGQKPSLKDMFNAKRDEKR